MLGIIGGTGLYNIDGLEILEEHNIETPYGTPSCSIIKGKYKERKIFFLPRHGKNHHLLPHEINYRANIWALKKLGVRKIIGISATGSLKEEIKPGDIAIPDQYFDFIKGNRERTFFGDGLVGHISTAKPTCDNLADTIKNNAAKIGLSIHSEKTYACVDGPRLGTRAESFFLKNAAKCDLVGMTNIPEAFLAREAQICYCTIAIATDYDCWINDPEEFVTLSQVMERYGQTIGHVKKILEQIMEDDLQKTTCSCRTSLNEAIITPDNALTKDKNDLLSLLRI